MSDDLKLHILIDKCGLEGYAIYNLCLEMVGKEGKRGKIDGQLRWRQLLLKKAQWSDEGRLEKIINVMSEVKLICSKSLKYGNLYIPKFLKRADDYTSRQLRSKSEQNTDNVRVEQIRTVIEEYIRIKGWEDQIKKTPTLLTEIFKRNCRPAKSLILAVDKKTEEGCKAIKTLGKYFNDRGLDWTLETVLKHLPRGLQPKTKLQQYKDKYHIEEKWGKK